MPLAPRTHPPLLCPGHLLRGFLTVSTPRLPEYRAGGASPLWALSSCSRAAKGLFFSAWQMASPCLLPFQGELADVARRRGIGATAICASFLQNAAAVTPLSQPGASASLLHTFPGVLRAPTCHTPSVPISSRSSPHCSSCVREPTTQTEAAFPISSSASARAASSRSVVCRVSRRKRQRSAWVIPRQ